jgi:hypothetical protein
MKTPNKKVVIQDFTDTDPRMTFGKKNDDPMEPDEEELKNVDTHRLMLPKEEKVHGVQGHGHRHDHKEKKKAVTINFNDVKAHNHGDEHSHEHKIVDSNGNEYMVDSHDGSLD